jgi:predicted nucleic acid-binding protein
MLIASIAAANACVVVTQNERDFLGVEFINPAR